jgi:hypothetical protein
MNRICCGIVSLFFLLSGCAAPTQPEEVVGDIRTVLEAQQTAWNRGDIDGFMMGYERAETTTFVSGDEITRGWQTVLERYKRRYKTPEDMGTLSFSELEIEPINYCCRGHPASARRGMHLLHAWRPDGLRQQEPYAFWTCISTPDERASHGPPAGAD